jgi:hypothetical protein
LERRRAEQALQKANDGLERKVAGRTHALLEANQRLETLKEIDRSILAAVDGRRQRGLYACGPWSARTRRSGAA